MSGVRGKKRRIMRLELRMMEFEFIPYSLRLTIYDLRFRARAVVHQGPGFRGTPT